MSRLFEAISIAEAKRGTPKGTPRAVAPLDAVPTNASGGSATPTERAPEADVKRLPSKLVRLTAALPEMPLPSVTAGHGSARGHARSGRGAWAELVPGAVALPDTVSQGVIGSAVAPAVPVKGVEIENRSSQRLHLNFVLPDVIPPDATAVDLASPKHTHKAKQLPEVAPKNVKTFETGSVRARVSPDSRLVALADPNSLGAEKFRALVTRLDHLRKQREMKSFQVTSSVINEGKTLVAGNVAVTLAKYSGAKTLLIEGDLHRPGLAALFGLSELPGLSHWWSGRDPELTQFVYKLDEMPLWFLSAGNPCDRPSDILRSARFAKAFAQLANQFEWIVVDSTPMLPIVDANLWSRLVDGTLLVVREGMAPVKALKKVYKLSITRS